MATSWLNNVNLIQDLVDYVRARDTNRPLAQLTQRTQYLYEALQAAQLGELLISRNVSVDELAVAGTPVWFDVQTSRWRPAQAELDFQTANDFGFAADKSEVRGLVLLKHTSSAGDVAIYGSIRQDVWGIDWQAVTDDQLTTAGRYYLSVDLGKITRARNVLSVEIGVLDSSGNLLFTPDITGSLRSHLHLRYALEAQLGTDLTDPGWIPVAEFVAADIPVPVGAVYGYNVELNSALAAKFPPIPLDNYHMAYNGVGVHRDSLVVDQHGIWWMNATESPDDMGVHLYQPSDTTSYFEFWMTLLSFGSKIVNTLQTDDSPTSIPITIQNVAGQPSDNGDLRIFLEEVLKIPDVLDESDDGPYALKNVTGVKGLLGPVVSRVIAGPGISVSASHGTSAGRFGLLTVSLSSALASQLRGNPTLVALDNAREDFYSQNLPVLNLPNGRRSGFKMKIQVPEFLTGTYQLVLRMGVISSSVYNQTVDLQSLIVRPGVSMPASPTAQPAVVLDVAVTNQLTIFSSQPVGGLLAGDLLLLDVQRLTGPTHDIMFANLVFELSEVV